MGNPSLRICLAYSLALVRLISSLFAPVQTTLPDLNIKAVVLGSRILMMQAANLLGLYSEFLALSAIDLRSSSHPRLNVLTKF